MHLSTLAQRQVHPSSPALLTKDIPPQLWRRRTAAAYTSYAAAMWLVGRSIATAFATLPVLYQLKPHGPLMLVCARRFLQVLAVRPHRRRSPTPLNAQHS